MSNLLDGDILISYMNDHSFIQMARRAICFDAKQSEHSFIFNGPKLDRKMSEGVMLRAIENMREIVDLCRMNRPLPAQLAEWLATALQEFLEHRSNSVAEAFGIRNARGGVPWWMETSMRTRDAALRRLAATYFEGKSVSARAASIRQLSSRYAASSWRHDQPRADMPASYFGTPHEWLWKAFKSGAAMPLCERQLRKILGP